MQISNLMKQYFHVIKGRQVDSKKWHKILKISWCPSRRIKWNFEYELMSLKNN